MKKKQPIIFDAEEQALFYKGFEMILQQLDKDKEAVRQYINNAEMFGLIGMSGKAYEDTIQYREMKDKIIEAITVKQHEVKNLRNKLYYFLKDYNETNLQ